MTNVELYNR